MNVCKKIRKIRREKEISQEYLAQKIGITKTSLCNYEKNKTEPKLSIVLKICKELGISISDVLEETK